MTTTNWLMTRKGMLSVLAFLVLGCDSPNIAEEEPPVNFAGMYGVHISYTLLNERLWVPSWNGNT